MNRRRTYRGWIAAASIIAAALNGSSASAGDCFRQMGIGYGAGYNAPAPYAHSATAAKLPGWMCWKGACCHPGTPAVGCGCGVAAPPCATCLPQAPACCPTCDPGVPCCGRLFGLLNHCGVRNPGIY